jgi:hypothetical protein
VRYSANYHVSVVVEAGRTRVLTKGYLEDYNRAESLPFKSLGGKTKAIVSDKGRPRRQAIEMNDSTRHEKRIMPNLIVGKGHLY